MRAPISPLPEPLDFLNLSLCILPLAPPVALVSSMLPKMVKKFLDSTLHKVLPNLVSVWGSLGGAADPNGLRVAGKGSKIVAGLVGEVLRSSSYVCWECRQGKCRLELTHLASLWAWWIAAWRSGF